jgi:peptidoglycan/xylan/chitin deacetylase (PgdA/CDA1 family)
VLSLRELNTAVRAGRVLARSVVITFDDGYLDNLTHAKPALERWGLPATVFAASGYIESGAEYWWDTLERVLLQSSPLPTRLSLTINGEAQEWDLGPSSAASVADGGEWSLLRQDDPTPRHRAYRQLHALIKPLPTVERVRLLEELLTVTRVAPQPHPDCRAMTPEELRLLTQGGLVDVGGHTVTHPVLGAQSEDLQRSELLRGREALETVLESSVPTFSYPYGSRADYNPGTVRLVREAGFDCACSNFEGFAQAETDPFQIPRVLVRNWDGAEFARRLEQWFCG